MNQHRCQWANENKLMQDYHDNEWGVPCFDDQILFEFLTLEGAQAGLSWNTVLKKRENYRSAFAKFNPEKVARFSPSKVEKLLQNEGIIRNRLKVESTISNAKAFLIIQKEHGSFSDFLWQLVDNKPIINRWKTMKSIPATTPLSDQLSKTLKKHGFRFVGPTICYAYMQAIGMVNDHLVSCACYKGR